MATKIPGWQTGIKMVQDILASDAPRNYVYAEPTPGKKWPDVDTQNQGL